MSESTNGCAALIIARLGSSRLPAKHLSVIHGKPIIEHLIDRVKLAKRIERIVLCTTTRTEDLALVEVADRCGISHFQGSELNLLQRFYDASTYFDTPFSVIVEGDEVVCDWELIDGVVERYTLTNADYVAVHGVPLGSYLHGVRTSALKAVCGELDETWETDGWGRYFIDTGLFSFKSEKLVVDDPALTQPPARMTLDWPEDLALIREIFARLYVPGEVFALRDVMALLHREPELLEINRHLVEAYEAHVANFAPPRVKVREEAS